MADELDILAQVLNRFIEQERFAEAQAMLPEYARVLDLRLRDAGGEQVLKRAMETFHEALAKVRIAKAHIAAEMSDANRARAYTGEPIKNSSQVQLVG
jgi:hypothetical protein